MGSKPRQIKLRVLSGHSWLPYINIVGLRLFSLLLGGHKVFGCIARSDFKAIVLWLKTKQFTRGGDVQPFVAIVGDAVENAIFQAVRRFNRLRNKVGYIVVGRS